MEYINIEKERVKKEILSLQQKLKNNMQYLEKLEYNLHHDVELQEHLKQIVKKEYSSLFKTRHLLKYRTRLFNDSVRLERDEILQSLDDYFKTV